MRRNNNEENCCKTYNPKPTTQNPKPKTYNRQPTTYNFPYHFIITLPQVNPLPKAAKTTVSPDLILPCSQASVNAIGMEAAVVLPYF